MSSYEDWLPTTIIRPEDRTDDEFWGIRRVMAKTGLSRSSIYAYVASGIFPRQRQLGARRIAWLASEIQAWIATRP